MKKFVVVAMMLLSISSFGQDTLRVLFLGNSYMGVNNLPQLVADLAYSAGDTVIFESNTPGGYTLEGHSTNAVSLQKIAQGNWDYVILQEQSQKPSFPLAQVQTETFPFAVKLDSLITAANPCTETMFYTTWGRENGDSGNCPFWPPVCTYEGMDDLLRQRYDQMAVDNEGVVSPVGPLWRHIRTNDPGLQLYASDGSHPSLAGSYAAACSFYSTLFRKDPTLITSDAGLGGGPAISIRNFAKAVVFDSLATWHIGEYDPVADFPAIFQVNNNTVQFTNQSTNGVNYTWDFGDGNSSTDTDPIHTYVNYGFFTVQLITEKCGIFDTITQQVELAISGLEENESLQTIQVSPNPTKENVYLQIENLNSLKVFNSIGKEVEVTFLKKGNGFEIDLSSLSNGIYLLKIESEGKFYQARVVKE